MDCLSAYTIVFAQALAFGVRRAVGEEGLELPAGRWALAVDGAVTVLVQSNAASATGFRAAHAGQEGADRTGQVGWDEAAWLGVQFAVVEGDSIVVAAGTAAKAGVVCRRHVVEYAAIGLRIGDLRLAHGCVQLAGQGGMP